MQTYILLILAAVLEVGGDALIRAGLQKTAVPLLIAGPAVLVIYGFMVNLTTLDFGHLMGMYIVIFFIVSQIISALILKERISPATLVGGTLVFLGGVVMAVWQR